MDKERTRPVLPLDFIEDMRQQLGPEAESLFRALDGEPTTAIRLNDKVNTLTKIKKITSGSTPEVAEIVDALYNSILKNGTHKGVSVIKEVCTLVM